MAAHTLSVLPIIPSQTCKKPIENSLILKSESLSNSFIGTKLSIQSSNFSILAAKRRSSTVSTVLFSLPTGKREKNASEGKPKWSARAIRSFGMAELEARKFKYPNTGTESLLRGILVEGTSLAAKFLRENGITLFKVRDETLKLLGKSNMFFCSYEHPPLTETAQRALDWALDEKLKSGGESGEVTAAHLLLGIWSEKESAGHKILAALGFDDEKAKEVAKSMDKDIVLSFKKGVSTGLKTNLP